MGQESGSGLAESSALGLSQDYNQAVAWDWEGTTSKPTGLWIGLSSF